MAADFLKVDYLFLAVGVVGGACSDVEQLVLEVNQFSKRDQLLEILKTTGMVLPAGAKSFSLFSVITFYAGKFSDAHVPNWHVTPFYLFILDKS